MEHTSVRFLEDDRLMIPIASIDDDYFPCIVYKTVFGNLESINVNGFAPGGDGITGAALPQISDFFT